VSRARGSAFWRYTADPGPIPQIDANGNDYTGEVDNAKRIQKFRLTSDALK
jgi:hypothetical protein